MFERMGELFRILNDARRRRGSIDFDLNEAEVIIDEGGMVEAIIALQRNVAHRLIEEFMLLANQTVASYLESQNAPALYRVHEEPDVLKVAKFEEFISGFGYSLGGAVDGAPAAPFPEADRADPGQARGKADRVSDAADDAEGAVRAREPRATSASPRRATRTSRRRSAAIRTWSCTARCARRATRRSPRTSARRWPRICPKSRATRPRWSAGPTMPSASCCSGRR